MGIRRVRRLSHSTNNQDGIGAMFFIRTKMIDDDPVDKQSTDDSNKLNN